MLGEVSFKALRFATPHRPVRTAIPMPACSTDVLFSKHICLRTKAPLWELWDPEPSVKECGRGLASRAFGNRQTELHVGTEAAEPVKLLQLLLLRSDKTLESTGCTETHGKENICKSPILLKRVQHITGENK